MAVCSSQFRKWACADPELDTMNIGYNSGMRNEAEERKLYRMAKVYNFLEIWQGSQNLSTMQNESEAQNMEMTTKGFISTRKRSLKHPGQSFIMMVQLQLNCQKDLLCHQLCKQKTSMEDKLNY
jgi:hypothetical protein